MPRKSAAAQPPRPPAPTGNLERLLAIMARLRDPETGCPWDVEQDFATIAPYTIEEAYEVADAIDRGDMAALREELGDLLLQTVFHARMAEEAGLFGFDDVAAAIADKLVRRHPHVFGDADREAFSLDVWEAAKAEERAEKTGGREVAAGVLEGVALALPALIRAEKLQKRAARVGFDWRHAGEVIAKIEEEIGELRAVLDAEQGTGGAASSVSPTASPAPEDRAAPAAIEEEVGDLLFAVVNLARKLGVDPEAALRQCNDKFQSRFKYIEAELEKSNKSVEETELVELEALWQAAKRGEGRRGP